jgi:hypothetical protein
MKKVTIVISIVLMHFAVYSQTDSISNTKYIKVYSTVNTLQSQSLPSALMPNIFAFGKITKKGNYREIQLSDPNIYSSTDNYSTRKRTNFTLSYEYGVKVLKSLKSDKWNTYLGINVSNLTSFSDMKYKDPLYFGNKQFQNHSSIRLVPKFEYNFNKRLFMDFSLPINIVSYSFSQSKYENPALTPEDKKSTYQSFNIFGGNNSPRVGFGLRI